MLTVSADVKDLSFLKVVLRECNSEADDEGGPAEYGYGIATASIVCTLPS